MAKNFVYDEYEDEYDDELTEEQLDEKYRRKKCNSMKSMAPLCVYKILMDWTDDDHHMSQKKILAMLQKFPYEITMERKALSRILHTLMDMGLGIVGEKGQGFWHTECSDEDCWGMTSCTNYYTAA